MSLQKRDFLLAFAIVLVAITARLLPHPFNFTPIGAMALFGGAMAGRQKMMWAVTFLSLWCSDLLLNNIVYPIWYPQFQGAFVWFSNPGVYIAFALMAVLGYHALQKRSAIRVFGVSVAGSLLFYFVTNFAVWATGELSLYPMTFTGLLTCLAAGLPFMSNEVAPPLGFLANGVLGDVSYTMLFFGLYALAQRSFNRVFA